MYVVHIVQGVHFNVRSRGPACSPVGCAARQCHASSTDLAPCKDVIYLLGDDKGPITRDTTTLNTTNSTNSSSSSSRSQPVAANTAHALRKAAGVLTRVVTPQLQLHRPAVRPPVAVTLGPTRTSTITLTPTGGSSSSRIQEGTLHAAGSRAADQSLPVIHLPEGCSTLGGGNNAQLAMPPPGASNLPVTFTRKSPRALARWTSSTAAATAAVPAPAKPNRNSVPQLVRFPHAAVHAMQLRRPAAVNNLQLAGAQDGLGQQLPLQLSVPNSDKCSQLLSLSGSSSSSSSTGQGLTVLGKVDSTPQLKPRASPPTAWQFSGPFDIIGFDNSSSSSIEGTSISTAGANSRLSKHSIISHIAKPEFDGSLYAAGLAASKAKLAAAAAAPAGHELFSGGNLGSPSGASGSSRGGGGSSGGQGNGRAAAQAVTAAASKSSAAAAAPASSLPGGGSSGALLPTSMRLARTGIALMGLAAAVALAAIFQEEAAHNRHSTAGGSGSSSSGSIVGREASQMTNNAVAAAALALHGAAPADTAAPGGRSSSSAPAAAAALDALDTPGYHDWMERRLQSALQQFTDEQNMLRAELSMLQTISSSKGAPKTAAKAAPSAVAGAAEAPVSSVGAWASLRRWFGGGGSSSRSAANIQAQQQQPMPQAAPASSTANLSAGGIAARIAEINEELGSLDVLKAALTAELKDQQQQRRRQQVQQISQQYGLLADGH